MKKMLNNFSKKLKNILVDNIYADHNGSSYIKSEINNLLKQYDDKNFVLNVGSVNKRLAPHVKNLDILDGKNVDYACSADQMPIESNSVDLIITQETFEHISNPNEAIKECFRVLKKDGQIYFQVPFIVGYHPGPTDFYRFTKEGIQKFLTDAGFKVEKIEITAAGATGFYRILVEFLAILFSGPISFLYMPLKGIFALIFYPLKLLDFWFRLSSRRDKIPCGYYAIGKKN